MLKCSLFYPQWDKKQYLKFDLSLKVPHLLALGHKYLQFYTKIVLRQQNR